MFSVSSLVVILLGLMFSVVQSHEAMAQQSSESSVAYAAARNKIGLIRYCRSNKLLDPFLASRAITALETGLGEPAPGDSLAREQGDRAQQTGEDGFWGAGGGRDVASAAKLLIRTTPEDLCREWAEETLRAQGRRREDKTRAVVAPAQPVEPLPRAEPASLQPTQKDRPFAGANAAVIIIGPAPPATPPLPEKAPFKPTGAEFTSVQRTAPTGGDLVSTTRAASGQTSGTTAKSPSIIPPASGQAAPLSAPPAAEPPGPLPSEQTASAAAVPSVWGKWPFNRLGKSERCLMAGCKWSAPRERRSLGD